MYSVVEFINEKSVAVVANSWLVADNLVMWPKSDKKRTALLERNERPPDGTPVHPVRVLSESLTLALARQRVEKALYTSDLSSSHPTQRGKGRRRKIPVAYPSDSDSEEDESEDEAPVTFKKLAPWPSMEPHLPAPSTSRSVSEPASSSQAADNWRINALEAVILQEFNSLNRRVELLHQENELLRKRQDAIAEDVRSILCKMEQVDSKLSDNRRSVPEPYKGRLPVYTKKDYEQFLHSLQNDNNCTADTVKHLKTVGGRDDKEVIRNLLGAILGPPLCLEFTWDRTGQSKKKRSFVRSPMYTIFSETIRQIRPLLTISDDEIQKIAIAWFHGSRDRYGGRYKRRNVGNKFPQEALNILGCGLLPPSQDTAPTTGAGPST